MTAQRTRSASSLIGTTSTAHLPASAPWLRTARYRRPDDAVCIVVLLDDRRHQAPDPYPVTHVTGCGGAEICQPRLR